jgi:hypothetical protein
MKERWKRKAGGEGGREGGREGREDQEWPVLQREGPWQGGPSVCPNVGSEDYDNREYVQSRKKLTYIHRRGWRSIA